MTAGAGGELTTGAMALLGLDGKSKPGADGPGIAVGILGNISYLFAPLATKWMAESPDVPIIIKMLTDAPGSIGAAGSIQKAAGLPPK